MPRPKYAQGERNAKDKLKDAFWHLLENMPYDKLTVRGITEAAGLNKNSFYYHFDDLDDLARKSVEDVLDLEFYTDLLKIVMAVPSMPDAMELRLDQEIGRRIERACVIAGSNSPTTLRCMLKEAIGSAWQQALGIDATSLALEDRLAFEYALGGVMAMFAYRADSGTSFSLIDLSHMHFAEGMLEVMRGLSKKSG